jgi:hypothetical protein
MRTSKDFFLFTPCLLRKIFFASTSRCFLYSSLIISHPFTHTKLLQSVAPACSTVTSFLRIPLLDANCSNRYLCIHFPFPHCSANRFSFHRLTHIPLLAPLSLLAPQPSKFTCIWCLPHGTLDCSTIPCSLSAPQTSGVSTTLRSCACFTFSRSPALSYPGSNLPACTAYR